MDVFEKIKKNNDREYKYNYEFGNNDKNKQIQIIQDNKVDILFDNILYSKKIGELS